MVGNLFSGSIPDSYRDLEDLLWFLVARNQLTYDTGGGNGTERNGTDQHTGGRTDGRINVHVHVMLCYGSNESKQLCYQHGSQGIAQYHALNI